MGDWSTRGLEGNGEKHGAWVRRPLTAELRSLNFILKAVGNQCNVFVVEQQPLEELSFQKPKRGRKWKLRKHGDSCRGRRSVAGVGCSKKLRKIDVRYVQ